MSDLIEQLKQASQVEGLTTSEILGKLGIVDTPFQRNKLLRRLRAEIAAGRAECFRAQRLRVDGCTTESPVYRLKG